MTERNEAVAGTPGDGEMAAALAGLNRRIAGATDRISVVRIQSSQGL